MKAVVLLVLLVAAALLCMPGQVQAQSSDSMDMWVAYQRLPGTYMGGLCVWFQGGFSSSVSTGWLPDHKMSMLDFGWAFRFSDGPGGAYGVVSPRLAMAKGMPFCLGVITEFSLPWMQAVNRTYYSLGYVNTDRCLMQSTELVCEFMEEFGLWFGFRQEWEARQGEPWVLALGPAVVVKLPAGEIFTGFVVDVLYKKSPAADRSAMQIGYRYRY